MKTFTSSSAKTIFISHDPDEIDRRMFSLGFHPSTPEEIARYGKFIPKHNIFIDHFLYYWRKLFKETGGRWNKRAPLISTENQTPTATGEKDNA